MKLTGTFVCIATLVLCMPRAVAFTGRSISQVFWKTSEQTTMKPPLFSITSSASSSSNEIQKESVNGIESNKNEANKNLFLQRIRSISNFASILCALDCTILPAITVGLPLLNLMEFKAEQMAFLHHLGHQVALWFVVPVRTIFLMWFAIYYAFLSSILVLVKVLSAQATPFSIIFRSACSQELSITCRTRKLGSLHWLLLGLH